MTMIDRRKLVSPPELNFHFQDNEILRTYKGEIQIHAALAANDFEIERVRHKITEGQNIDRESILVHQVGKRFLVLATEGAEIFIHRAREGDIQAPPNCVEIWDLKEPHKTGNNSDAVYVCKYQANGITFLVQYLEANSVSSHHRHHVMTEYFFTPYAVPYAFAWHNEADVVPLNGQVEVKIEEPHAVFALDEPTIAFILENSDKDEHDPEGLEKPTIEFLRQQTIRAGLIAA